VRTTLTLDDDVAKLVREEVRRTGNSFKGTVNQLLRQGFIAGKQQVKHKPFVVKPIALGLPAGLSYDCIPELLEKLDGPDWL
jgi:hypothetical protein